MRNNRFNTFKPDRHTLDAIAAFSNQFRDYQERRGANEDDIRDYSPTDKDKRAAAALRDYKISDVDAMGREFFRAKENRDPDYVDAPLTLSCFVHNRNDLIVRANMKRSRSRKEF